MAKAITPSEGHEELIDRAMCPRCGGGVKPVGVIRDDGEWRNVIGYRVQHEDPDVRCSNLEWPIHDPEAYEDDINQRGGGLSICMTCLSSYQHIGREDDEWMIEEPNRDEAGQIMCTICDRRTNGR